MRDGYFLLPCPGPCQRHDPFPIPARAGTHAVAWAGCTPLQLNRIRSVGLRIVRLRVRILSGAFRGRRPVAGRPVRNGKVAGSNPAGSTTCGMPPRVSADIPGKRRHVKTARPRDGIRETAASRRPRARRRGRPHKPRVMGPDSVPPRRGCGAVAARLLPKQETAGSNPVIRSIRKTRTMDPIQQWDPQPSFPCGRFRRKHGRTASAWARGVKE